MPAVPAMRLGTVGSVPRFEGQTRPNRGRSMFSRSDLDELVAMDARPALSIYFPTHIAGREIRQDPIRLKNLLSSAADRLAATWRRPEIEDFLGPAESLVGDEEFWRHQQQGLAAFLAPVSTASTNSRFRFRRRASSATISISSPCFRCSRTPAHSGCSRSAPATPASTRGPGGNFPKTRGSICRRASAAKAQSFGDHPDQIRKEELLEFLHRVVLPVEPLIKRSPAPVIVAGASRAPRAFPADRRMEGDPTRRYYGKSGCSGRSPAASGRLCTRRAKAGRGARRGGSIASTHCSRRARRQPSPRRSSKPRATRGFPRPVFIDSGLAAAARAPERPDEMMSRFHPR
jgi:hypothetical protein